MEPEIKEKDIAEVVRCKNCLFYTGSSGWCNLHISRMTYNDFCSYGRSKE